jgi:hypothetical protein
MREFAGRIEGLQKLNERGDQALIDLKAQMTDTHELAAYTLRNLGDRAKLTDPPSSRRDRKRGESSKHRECHRKEAQHRNTSDGGACRQRGGPAAGDKPHQHSEGSP